MSSSHASSSSVRPLGALEHLFWCLDEKRPTHFVTAFKVSGRTTPDQWRAGLDAVQQRHPLLSCSISVGQTGPEFYRSAAAVIPIRDIDAAPLSGWQREFENELALPFDCTQAPLLRTVLLRQPDSAVLLVSTFHSLADANWTCFFMRDLLQAMSGRELMPLSLLPPQEILLAQIPAQPEGVLTHEQTQAQAKPPDKYVEEGSRASVDSLSFTAAFTSELRKRARVEQTTVQGAICAAAALAGKRISPRWRDGVRLLSPASTRKLLGVEDGCGLFLNIGMLQIGAEMPGSLWDLARALNRSLALPQSRAAVQMTTTTVEGLLHDLPGVEAVAGIAAQAFGREIMVSNLGSLAIEVDYGPLRLEEVWGPATLEGFEGEHTLGAVTINGALRLLLVSCDPLPSLLKELGELLAAGCKV